MDELTTRQRLTYLLRSDITDGDAGDELGVVVEDHMAAIRHKSGGGWDRILAAEYVHDLEQMLALERIEGDEEDLDEGR